MRDARAAIALLFGSTIFLSVLMLTGPVEPNRTLAAFYPPWFDRTEVLGAVSAAGGSMLRHGGIDSVALVRLDSPDAAARLKNAGAWAVVDPAGLLGCVGLKDGATVLFQKETTG